MVELNILGHVVVSRKQINYYKQGYSKSFLYITKTKYFSITKFILILVKLAIKICLDDVEISG